jgi:HAD superfamily hydrolase (TIGR01509 family)
MKALIFDFDGLIFDTEVPDFQSWQEVYREHGVELLLEKWAEILGGAGASDFDPHDYLEELVGHPVDKDEIWIKRRKIYVELMDQRSILPGVEEYLTRAKELGLKLGIASSSPECWVSGHLTSLGLIDQFEAIKTADDVEKTKPEPELFLETAKALDTPVDQIIVFEDSPNGVLAAKRAGMYCVAVPNPLTAQLSLEGADRVLESLADVPLEKLLGEVREAVGEIGE